MVPLGAVPIGVTMLAGLLYLPPALARCPEWPMGISVTSSQTDRQFFATAAAEALSDSDGSRELAAAEARIAAKALLRDDKRVPKSSTGRLRGVREMGLCDAGMMVYATVMVDETNARRAAALEDAIATSIHAHPPPLPAQRSSDGNGIGLTPEPSSLSR
jgi:hypothetical protein